MAKNFKDLHTIDAKDMTRDQAMIYVIWFNEFKEADFLKTIAKYMKIFPWN